jgi:hypothetical protein
LVGLVQNKMRDQFVQKIQKIAEILHVPTSQKIVKL